MARVLKVEGHDGDVRFYTGSGNMTVTCMRNAFGHNYRNPVRSLWNWLWGRYHVPHNIVLVIHGIKHSAIYSAYNNNFLLSTFAQWLKLKLNKV